MFICRFRLLRLHITSKSLLFHSRKISAVSKLPRVSNANDHSAADRARPVVFDLVNDGGGSNFSPDLPLGQPQSQTPGGGGYRTKDRLESEETLEAAQKTEDGHARSGNRHKHLNDDEQSLALYLSLRQRDRFLVSTLPVHVFLGAYNYATQLKSVQVLDNMAADILEVFVDNVRLRRGLIVKFLSLDHKQPLLKHERVLALFDALVRTGAHKRLFRRSLNRVSLAAIAVPLDTYPSVIEPLIELLFAAAEQARDKYGGDFLSHEPPLDVYRLFYLIRMYISSEQYARALDIFQRLVDTNLIPDLALRHAHALNDTSADFSHIVLSVLVKSCLRWRWRRRAIPFLIDLIKCHTLLNENIRALTLEVLATLLEIPTPECLLEAQDLMVLFIDRAAPDFPLYNRFIANFYSRAYELSRGDMAEVLYNATQSPDVLKKHVYIPPQGQALVWFLQHLTSKSKNIHLARTLVSQVVDSPKDIDLLVRAEFIATAAVNGFATSARTLWVRYVEGEEKRIITKGDGEMVAGNAATALRMVSLFADLIKKEDAKLEALENIPTTDEAGMEDVERNGEEMSNKDELELHEARLQDFSAFAAHVVAKFRATVDPIDNANHLALTSLARMYFMLGDVSAGFDVFKVLLSRHEIPDVYDVNVALSALVEYDVRAASKIVERMMKKGMVPDAVTLGTIINGGLKVGDMEMVDWAVKLGKILNVQELTMKTVSAIVHASVSKSIQEDTPGQLKENLRRVLQMVRAAKDKSYLPTPNTGKLCVWAALKANEGQLAFTFWTLLLKGKAEWDDSSHVSMRLRIARQLKRDVAYGWIEDENARAMLEMLREQVSSV